MLIAEPVPEYSTPVVPLARRPDTLDGKVIGFLDGWGRRMDDGTVGMYPLMEALKDLLAQRYDLANVIWIHKPKAASSPTSEQMKMLLEECDVVINGVCLSGGCTAGSVRDAVELEKLGLPTVTIAHTEYEHLARSLASNLGLPELPLFVVATPVGGNVNDDTDSVADRLAEVLEALTTAAENDAHDKMGDPTDD